MNKFKTNLFAAREGSGEGKRKEKEWRRNRSVLRVLKTTGWWMFVKLYYLFSIATCISTIIL